MKQCFIISILFFTACTKKNVSKSEANIIIPPVAVESTDPLLHLKNGYWFYKEELFSGIINERYANGNIHNTTSYWQGREEGKQLSYFDPERLAEQRYYHAGEKDGVHTGWWPNGNPRFEYHFKNGIYDGDFKEWYESGEILKHIHYTKGVDDWGKGWRQNGKLYMNFVVQNGRRYGLNNSNLCYTVKNGNGEFVASFLTTIGDSSSASEKKR